MIHPLSQRGWFDYHYIGTEPVLDNDPDKLTDIVPTQFVICDGNDGGIVTRIALRGSRRKQLQRAIIRLMVHMMAEP